MPFSTDNSWPAGLLKIFEICWEMNRPLENCYYGPYDKLINYCFGDSFTFFVAPQHPLNNATKEAIDFIIFLIVFDALRRPVLIAKVKDDSWARTSARGRWTASSSIQHHAQWLSDGDLHPPSDPIVIQNVDGSPPRTARWLSHPFSQPPWP